MSRLCAKAFGIECGNHLCPIASEIAYYCIYRLLVLHGMIKGDEAVTIPDKLLACESTPTVYRTLDRILPRAGFRFTLDGVGTGRLVRKGEVYALAEDYSYKAEQECYLVMPSKKLRHD